MAKFEPMTVVRVNLSGKPRQYAFPFHHGQAVLFMGEVKNKPGTAVVAAHNGDVYWGYSLDYFVADDAPIVESFDLERGPAEC